MLSQLNGCSFLMLQLPCTKVVFPITVSSFMYSRGWAVCARLTRLTNLCLHSGSSGDSLENTRVYSRWIQSELNAYLSSGSCGATIKQQSEIITISRLSTLKCLQIQRVCVCVNKLVLCVNM